MLKYIDSALINAKAIAKLVELDNDVVFVNGTDGKFSNGWLYM